MKRIISTMCFLVVVLVLQLSFTGAQTNAFTYEGKSLSIRDLNRGGGK